MSRSKRNSIHIYIFRRVLHAVLLERIEDGFADEREGSAGGAEALSLILLRLLLSGPKGHEPDGFELPGHHHVLALRAHREGANFVVLPIVEQFLVLIHVHLDPM